MCVTFDGKLSLLLINNFDEREMHNFDARADLAQKFEDKIAHFHTSVDIFLVFYLNNFIVTSLLISSYNE